VDQWRLLPSRQVQVDVAKNSPTSRAHGHGGHLFAWQLKLACEQRVRLEETPALAHHRQQVKLHQEPVVEEGSRSLVFGELRFAALPFDPPT
jgi:hypothetical protein